MQIMDMDLTCMEEGLFDFNTVWMENRLPDISIVSLRSDVDLTNYVLLVMREGYIQTIINNLDPETRPFCPYFRVFMDQFGNDCPINFKLQSFFNRIGMSSLNPRCRQALVVGLHSLDNLNSAISVPMAFCSTTIDPIRFYLDEIDLACLSPCAKELYPSDYTLADIAGLSVPYYLPPFIQWKIVSYLRNPLADIVVEAMEEVCKQWDMSLWPMYLQREPRIPVDIASYYGVPTVLTTIGDAIRPFLVPTVDWRERYADQET